MVMTGISGLVYAYCTVTMKANQVVVGIALNIFADGITTTLYRMIFGMGSSSTKVDSFTKMGPLNVPVYIGILLVILLTVFLYKTKYGLQAASVGIPTQLILMIPYLLTVIVVAVFGQKGSGPAALGIPFSKNQK